MKSLLPLGGVILALARPSVASAQRGIEIVPFFASFYALSPFATNQDDGNGGTFSNRLTNAAAIGGRLHVGLTRGLGIEGSFTYAWSGAQAGIGRDPAGNLTSFGAFASGHVIMASGRVTLHPKRSNFRLIGGIGYQQRGGDAWDETLFGVPAGTFDKTSIGGVVGVGVRANITPKIPIDFDLEAFLYSSDADGSGNLIGYENKFQQDITLSIGIPLKLSGK